MDNKKSSNIRVIVNKDAKAEGLSVGERKIFDHIKRSKDSTLKLSLSMGTSVRSLQSDFAAAMESEHRNKFYKENQSACLFGLLLSVLGVTLILKTFTPSENIPSLLIFTGLFAACFMYLVLYQTKKTLPVNPLQSNIVRFVLFALIAFASQAAGAVVVIAFGLFKFADTIISEPVLFIALIGIVSLNVLFYFLLGAPTVIGRRYMDQIEGLKIYPRAIPKCTSENGSVMSILPCGRARRWRESCRRRFAYASRLPPPDPR